MHSEVYAFVQQTLTGQPRPNCVVEFGGQDVNSSARGLVLRSLFPGVPYLSVDIADGPGVDVVADAATWVAPVAPDLILCCEVLEHVPDETAAALCRNAHRLLSPGGRAIVTAAWTGRLPHSGRRDGSLEADEFYRNVTESLLADWLRPFATVQFFVESRHRDLYATAHT